MDLTLVTRALAKKVQENWREVRPLVSQKRHQKSRSNLCSCSKTASYDSLRSTNRRLNCCWFTFSLNGLSNGRQIDPPSHRLFPPQFKPGKVEARRITVVFTITATEGTPNPKTPLPPHQKHHPRPIFKQSSLLMYLHPKRTPQRERRALEVNSQWPYQSP